MKKIQFWLLALIPLMLACSEEEVVAPDVTHLEVETSSSCLSAPPRPGNIRDENFTPGPHLTICAYDLAGSGFNVAPVSGATSYEWRFSPSAGVTTGSLTPSRFLDFFYAPPGSYSLEVRAINSCGAGPWSGAAVNVTNCSGGGGGGGGLGGGGGGGGGFPIDG